VNTSDVATTKSAGYPAGYVVEPQRPDVFDPALKHHQRAFVKGAPTAADQARALDAARSALLRTCLDGLAASAVRDALVLRGSLTLETWFPDRARRAHDIDFVVRDAATDPDSPAASKLLGGIREAVCGALRTAKVEVRDDEIAVDSIWTYERAEGRRLSVPWIFAGTMRDAIQIDIVFHEPLQDVPTLAVLRETATAQGYREAPAGLWYASRAESLAWKLLWLANDRHPQAKDLYDAVLLAEHTPLPLELLHRVHEVKGEKWAHGRDVTHMCDWGYIDWQDFALEYPELAAGNAMAWSDRLVGALRLVD
jgi:Nucleotidyl transferase AbiEii toxin, Type IV TA system